MNEDFLQFIWNFNLFTNTDLKTTEGEKIEIISKGELNKNSGPDFYNAKVKIGDTVWAGTIEIHCNASDWKRHKHETDAAYNNVILHVVEKNDCEIKRNNGQVIPALEITYPHFFKERYTELAKSESAVPCANYLTDIEPFKIQFWLNRMGAERLERKTNEIIDIINQTNGDMDKVLYYLLFKYFGFKVNTLPFEMLVLSIPVKVLRKYYKSLTSLEAVLFGQAGFLPDNPDDEYQNKLINEYNHIKTLYSLTPIDKSVWKFSKLRPANFPTIRIAQLAQLLNKHESLWNSIMKLDNITDVYRIFDVTASEYWDNHYVFGKESAKKSKKHLGDKAAENIIVNVLSPLLFACAEYKGDEQLREKALYFMENVKAEANSVISEWGNYNIKPSNALESQALLHLKYEYCSNKKCLNCAIGKQVIQNIIKS